jgi:uncharacterized protein YjbI with pentapeptide repeats
LVSANLCDVRFRRSGYYLALVLEGESEPTDYTDYSEANYSEANYSDANYSDANYSDAADD